MRYSLSLLTVSVLAAAPLVARADPSCPCAANQVPAGVVTAVPIASAAPTFRDRLRAVFGLPPRTETFQTVIVPKATTEPPVIVQVGHTVYSQGVAAQVVVAPVQMPEMQVAARYQDKVGHETDYSWITGHLFYVHTGGGRWVLRYTAVGEVDRFGGSVVLTPTVEMRNYREGDLVNVFGEVLNDGQSARPLGGPLYRVNSIQMVERADP